MKKLLILLAILVLAIVGIYNLSNESHTNNTARVNSGDTYKPDPADASFTFEDGSVTLDGGSGSLDEENGFEEIVISDTVAYGDINDDDKNDAALILVRSGAGSGVFVYVAAYVSGQVNYKGSNAVFVGDRVSPLSLDIRNGVITLTYLDRKEGEALSAEPTVERRSQYIYQRGQLMKR